MPIGFVRMITSPGRAPALVATLLRIDHAGDGVAKHYLLIVDAVAANQRDAILVERLQTAAHDLAEDRRIDALLWESR